MDEDVPWLPKHMESGPSSGKLDCLKKTVSGKPFRDPADLKRKLFADLKQLLEAQQKRKAEENKPALTRRIRLILEGDVADFTPQRQSEIIRVLAVLLRIEETEIRLPEVQPGSLRVHIEIPLVGVKRLYDLAIGGDLLLKNLGIKAVTFCDNEETIQLGDAKAKIVILLLTADPSDASRLRIGEEFRQIRNLLQAATLRDKFELHQRLSVRSLDVVQALLELRPQIVHFSGHGTSAGQLCFENQQGATHPVQKDALEEVFKQFAEHINCVILNACYAEKQARAITRQINYVIGMHNEIEDRAAIDFAAGFYQALGAGCTIEKAFDLGCTRIRLESSDKPTTPVLMKKTLHDIKQATRGHDRATSLQKYIAAVAEAFAILPMIGFERTFPMDSIYIPLTMHAEEKSRCLPGEDKQAGKPGAGVLKAEDLLDLPPGKSEIPPPAVGFY